MSVLARASAVCFLRQPFCKLLQVAILFGALLLPLRPSQACGCFAPPDLSRPLLQAGEEILFVVENGRITMHIKMRYSGPADQFGWLLPLPAPPTDSKGVEGIDIGSDELFDQLEARTAPVYSLQRLPCMRSGGRAGCGGDDSFGTVSLRSADGAGGDAPDNAAVPSPLLKQDSVGPYNYAILKADDKNAMLGWLTANGYIVPAGSDEAIAQYIRPGAYFLALRLNANATAGQVQPVVLSYPSDLPMIPITLTSVGATPNMGVLVWVLGSARAIPRNYANVVLNDAQLDWLNKIRNYNDVVIRAVAEAPSRHAFVTEYANSTAPMKGMLNTPNRFSALSTVMTEPNPARSILSLRSTTDPVTGAITKGFAWNSQLFGVLSAHVPLPALLAQEGVTISQFYTRIDYYLDVDRVQRPSVYADIEPKLQAFNPAQLARDLDERIAKPTLAAGALFEKPSLPKLTRLYTTLSPEDMNRDPVFSFNPDLASIELVHSGRLDLKCDNQGGTLKTADGFEIEYSQEEINSKTHRVLDGPWSLRIESISDTGQPQVLIDNTKTINNAINGANGCSASKSFRGTSTSYLALCALALTALLFRRRTGLFLRRRIAKFLAVTIVFGALSGPLRDARACGCFAPPDLAKPLVQAGEEILFIVENGKVTMHVRMRYSGPADRFGWLLPLPAPPTDSAGVQGMDVGTDELFDELAARTAPLYILNRTPCISSGRSSGGCGPSPVSFSGGVPPETNQNPGDTVPSPLVKQDSVGPFSYAILQANDQSAMLNWLVSNGYVVPAGSDAAIAQYIRPGAYFLALRLNANATAGQVQPVVLTYPSDLPMIPITLTAVGATPSMGILVYVLGSARAVPRNYAHVAINDAQLDWLNKIRNYNDVVIRAVAEAPNKHGFVTEYASDASVMVGVLNFPGRYDFLPALSTQSDAALFIESLRPQLASEGGLVLTGFVANSQLFGVLGAHVPLPAGLAQEGVTPKQYYDRISYYLKDDRPRRPQIYADIEPTLQAFNPAQLVRDLTDRIVTPSLAVGAKFSMAQLPMLTRLYTTLSPEDMNSDPVFSFNRELPKVEPSRSGRLQLKCDRQGGTLYVGPDPFVIEYAQEELDQKAYRPLDGPWSQRVESIGDTGQPQVIVDNSAAIHSAIAGQQGCATPHSHRSAASSYLALCALTLTALLFRQRRRRAR